VRESRVIVPPQYHGERTDVVLAKLFPNYSRAQLSHWLKEGSIMLNSRVYKPREKLHGGESIVMTPRPIEQSTACQAEDIPINVVFEDDELLVINKPAGLVVHPGAGNACHTLVNALLHHDKRLFDLPRAGIVHRLDKDTTGLMIIAKTLTSHTHLIRQMQARDIQRHYQTLVYGHLISGGTLTTGYGRDPHNRLKMAVCLHGKEAITHYLIEKHYLGFTLLNVKLMTGRTHQIRVHMAHLHHPVVGDPIYGGRNRYPAGIEDDVRTTLQQFKRQALHAISLSFVHPVSQERLTFKAPLPDDFQSLLTCLDAHDA
jgi:23S rRNA pseudouridine1911/1915/1917 synthase